MEKIEIAKIVKEQGIKGDVKVIVFADDDFDFLCLKQVYVKNLPTKIEKVYKVSGGYGLKLDIIDSRNTASEYKNASIFANRADLENAEGRYFIADLIDKIAVLETGEEIGKITDIQNFGSADVFYILKNGKQVLISHVEGLINFVEDEKVVLNSQKFKEVAVYED